MPGGGSRALWVSAAAIRASLETLGRRLEATKTGAPADLAQAHYYARLILNPSQDGLAAIVAADAHRALEPPPGMPIGDGGELDQGQGGDGCWFCEAVSLGR